MGLAIETSMLAAAGQQQAAQDRAREAEDGMLELGMAVHAACMRLRRGELTAGSAGAQLVEDAFSTLARHAIAAPTQIADMLLPPVLGWW